ncbi:DUF4399 domain-containing protein [Marinobacterium weihaiense]|uniref:DUF4399 domain-containing protein n=1 Tax=Marinobacterium weihaiense TaxID=2851016 RepID=A0ABS6M647_9GAMM|nr:DUF4399 domain-containing protein [Marinobacterium weihaiense]MBV0931749.1 DUF4399 domain-containing protein [Marinobacterium weihaiense]
MLKSILVFCFSALLAQGVFAAETATPAPADAKVYFITPEDGATVPQTFKVQFGLSGMGVAPAGMDKANTGHHHLMIDGKEMPMSGKAMGQEVMHFGGGQTETMVTLPAGQHTLQLILGDMGHAPHHPPVMSEVITIQVE